MLINICVASPPKIVTFAEIMKATAGVSNMMLAHNIATAEQFRFEKHEPPDDRFVCTALD